MKKRKKLSKFKLKIGYVLVLLVLITIFLLFHLFPKTPKGTITSTTTIPYIKQLNCEDMMISIDSIEEAIAYQRFGISRQAIDNYKFEVIKITVTNIGNPSKDFSGYKLQLVAGNKSYSPFTFHNIEKITLMDNSLIDYNCNESYLAYKPRFELDIGESSTGCKIFEILKNAIPTLLLVYNITGLKCIIPI